MLPEILAATRRRLDALQPDRIEIAREAEATAAPPPFRATLAVPGMSVIAEVKRRSPSRGDLAPDLDPVTHATAYVSGGAVAVSVLTEPEYFSGSPADLIAVAATGIPTLRKDFILDPIQILEARAWGASAVLLIVAALNDDELRQLIDVAAAHGLDALVEVHTLDEAHRAVAAGASIVGVNNRDLEDFSVDLATAEAIAPVLEAIPLTVAESGIFAGADARRMEAAGYDAVLVGEALVKAPDPAALITELRSV